MLAQLAWKNIWRNKIRSLVVITSVMLGIWAGTFIMSYVFGMMEQRLSDAIENEISHIQIHHPDYDADNDPVFVIPQSQQLLDLLDEDEKVDCYSARILAYGMINSASTSAGGKLIGIDPDQEDELTNISQFISSGEFLDDSDKNKIVIGQRLADKLKVKVRSKLVLTFQDVDKNIVAGAFRVKGIYESYNSSLEELNIYLNDKDLIELLGNGVNHHEIALLMNDSKGVDQYSIRLSAANPGLKVETWKELSPELNLMIETMDQSMMIFLIIILVALSFGIVNTMLMAVLERVREIGMLMAIGMNRTRLFAMISLETIFMVMIASPAGLLLAFATIEYLGTYGLDLSAIYAEGYAQYGFKSLIYPTLGADYYLKIVQLVFITAILSSIYPAITALRLNPVTAIRKI